MTNLICNVNSCVHNQCNLCCKEGIQVGGQGATSSVATCCESYEEKNGSFTNSAESPKYSLNIACDATTCTYNNCHMCEAEAININSPTSSSSETECASFVAKL